MMTYDEKLMVAAKFSQMADICRPGSREERSLRSEAAIWRMNAKMTRQRQMRADRETVQRAS
jgi:hypothetical protein